MCIRDRGYGIAKNILQEGFNLDVIAHKNRIPVDKLVKLGATEVSTYDELIQDIDCLIICVTNTKIAKEIADEIVVKSKKEILFIDITTHHKNGSIEMENILSKNKISKGKKPHSTINRLPPCNRILKVVKISYYFSKEI